MAADLDAVRLRACEGILKHCAPKLSEDEIEEKGKVCKKVLSRLKEGAQIDRNCLINDALYGPVELTPLMYNIINTSEFHRLKDIKQLGAAHYVYPGANHTKFDYSIGVCHLAGEFGRHLQRQLKEDTELKIVKADPDWKKLWIFDDKEVLCIQIAGLCHDLGHGPYSPMFREDFGVLKKSESDLSVSIFKRMLVENAKVLVEFVTAGLGKSHVEMIEWMIQPEKLPKGSELRKRAFLFEIIFNRTTGIDVKIWDRYARDCHYLGVTSDFQWRRCMHLGRIIKDKDELHIAFRDKQLDDIYGMYRTGVILYQKAYHHKTIKAVEKMTSDAILCVRSCLKLIQGREGPAKSIEEALEAAENDNLEWYLALTDSIIGMIKCADLKSVESHDQEVLIMKAKDLLKRIEQRDLYHMADKVRIPKMYSILNSDEHLREKNAVWKAAWDNLRLHQARNDAIYKQLDARTKEEIGEDDIWVSIIEFKHPPDHVQQEVINGHNPAEKVLFYKKRDIEKETDLLSPPDVKSSSSSLVVPQAFVECEVRVYDIRPADQRKKEHETALKNALQAWKESTEENVKVMLDKEREMRQQAQGE